MTESETEEYPSPYEALFGNSHIANLRCAVKYFAWQGAYALLAVVGLVALAAYTVYTYAKRAAFFIGGKLPSGAVGRGFMYVGRPVGQRIEAGGSRIKNGWLALKDNDRVVLGFMLALLGVCAVGAIAGAGWLLWTIIQYPVDYLMAIGVLAHLAVFLFGLLIYVDERETTVTEVAGENLSKAGQKAQETPGVRRVYGNCPVHFSLEPKWFEALANKFE